MILNHFKIKKLFKIIITAQDITKGKPDPEPYLITAKKLQKNPKNCLAIEDSQSGVLSAKAAGMKCIAITTTHSEKDLANANLVVYTFSEINEDIIKTI